MRTLSELLLEEYEAKLSEYRELEGVIDQALRENLEPRFKNVFIEHRIKSPESVIKKLNRKAAKYRSIDEITDVVGFRVICYFADQVDEAAEIINDLFEIDERNSVDKRDILDPSTFGYLSIHYICRLKNNNTDLQNIAFEVQIRTMLQHTWAEIEHDMGYKSELAVPREVRRDFARVASLLEIADGYFLNIKQRLRQYEENVRENIRNNQADDMAINRVTLEEFIRSGHPMQDLNNAIAAISGAQITEVQPDICIPMLEFLGVTTIRDLKALINDQRDHAIDLARGVLEGSEIDDLISTVGIYYLCRAKLVYGGYNREEIYAFCALADSNHERVAKKAERILEQQQALSR